MSKNTKTKKHRFKLERAHSRDQGSVQKIGLNQIENNVNEGIRLPVRRGFPFSDTVYLKVTIQGVETLFVLDSGAEKTLVSEKIFNQIKVTIATGNSKLARDR